MEINRPWTSGIHLTTYTTKAKNGTLLGFDADVCEVVAYKGKVIPMADLPKRIKVIK